MATKKKSASNVTRIKATSSKSATSAASDATSVVAKKAKKTTSAAKVANVPVKSLLGKIFHPLILLGGYFKGAWAELRQVRWPNRQATWSLTAAVLLFTGFFTLLILLLDAGFKYLFELLLT